MKYFQQEETIMTTHKITFAVLSFIVTGAAFADDGHQLAQRMLLGETNPVPVQQTADVSMPNIDGHARAAALLTQAFRTSATTGNSSRSRQPKDDPMVLARQILVGR
jgi:hypothetical protein